MGLGVTPKPPPIRNLLQLHGRIRRIGDPEGHLGADGIGMEARGAEQDVEPAVRMRHLRGRIPVEAAALAIPRECPPDGHEEIQIAVVVGVRERRAVPFPQVVHPGRSAHVGEGAVPEVAKQPICLESLHGWRAYPDEDVEPAVVVVVAEGGRHGAEVPGEPGFRGYIGEGAVALVPVKRQAAALGNGPPGDSALERHLHVGGEAHDQDVEAPVVVVVEKEPDETLVRGGDAGRVGNVLEPAAFEVAVEHRTVEEVDDQEVGPAVIVIVAEG